MYQVAGVLGVWRIDRRRDNLRCELVYFFGLADDVMIFSHDVHISGKAFEVVLRLVPKPGYFVDRYTYTRVSTGAAYLSYLKLR